jgi:hypothetical protein
MSQPITTFEGRELSGTKHFVNIGEQHVVRIYLPASTAVSWAGATAQGAIRTQTGALIHTYSAGSVSLDDDGNGTIVMTVPSTATDDFAVGTYYENFSVTAGANGPFHTDTFRVIVNRAPVSP